ncbi:MAG: hypothetical protein JO225_14655 [Candidatus Eremiobacteraeota bacterium]|nr:hypothetical protein [Candidatus Eremiobacteraeota bacterium]
MGSKIVRAFNLRQEAIRLITEAKAELLDEIGAPHEAPADDEDGPETADVASAAAKTDVAESAELDELPTGSRKKRKTAQR